MYGPPLRLSGDSDKQLLRSFADTDAQSFKGNYTAGRAYLSIRVMVAPVISAILVALLWLRVGVARKLLAAWLIVIAILFSCPQASRRET